MFYGGVVKMAQGTSESLLKSSLENMENLGPVGRFIAGLHCGRIGEYVKTVSQVDRDVVTAAVSICRRRFKEKDIILLDILDDRQNGEKGIAFTETSVFYWDSEFICQFMYSEIENVDYSDDDFSVTVETVDGESYELECGGTEEELYERYMYNFLLDIRDFVKESAGEAEVLDDFME